MEIVTCVCTCRRTGGDTGKPVFHISVNFAGGMFYAASLVDN